jgi:hypothetical protein
MKISNILLFLGVISLFSSCINELNDVTEEGVPVPLDIVDASLTTSGTRAATTLATSGDAIGLFLAVGTPYSAINNAKYIYTTAWAAASTAIYLTKSTASLCAYYPYVSGATVSRSLAPAVYSTASDLCYKNGLSASSTASSLSFEMGHAYSRLTMTISKGTYGGTGAISSITFANTGLITSSTLNISTGSYTTVTTGGTYTDAAPAIASLSTAATKQYLMVPCTLSGSTTLTLMVDGANFVGTIPNATLAALLAGKNHTISLSLTNKSFVVNTVSTTDWVTGTIYSILTADYISRSSAANCYMLSPLTSISIPVDQKGNGESISAVMDGLSTTHTAYSVGVLWQSTSNLVTCKDFNFTTQRVTVYAPLSGISGNALIAAYAADSTTILWSWHIWVTSYNPKSSLNGTVYSLTTTSGVVNVFMDRNLGSAGTTYINDANILHYQWGRKDPFPNATVVNASGTATAMSSISSKQTQTYSSQHPFTFIVYSGDWCSTSSEYYWMGTGGSTTTPGVKTIIDPCPYGWRVPAWRSVLSPWSGLSTTGATWGSGTTAGYTWASVGFWPASGYRDGSDASLGYLSTRGYYWSASPSSSSGYHLGFSSGSVDVTDNGGRRSNGFAVRCVQEW